MIDNSKELLKRNKIEFLHNFIVYKNTPNESFFSFDKVDGRVLYIYVQFLKVTHPFFSYLYLLDLILLNAFIHLY